MSALRLDRPRDVEELERRAGAYLLGREVEHTILLGIVLGLRAGLWRAHDPYFAVVSDGERVVAVAMRTPPWNVLLSAADERALDPIADDLLREAPDLTGVTAEQGVARAFADRWRARTGRAYRVHMAERLFRLERVIAPRPVSGSVRDVSARDRELLAAWLSAFQREALGKDLPDPHAAADAWIERRGRRMFVWDDTRPVSLCGVSARTPNTARIAPVYTPPDLRGRGYASASVAAVSQAQLEEGVRSCLLFTDLANPTSNRIYQAIGYRPVGDFDDVRFEGA